MTGKFITVKNKKIKRLKGTLYFHYFRYMIKRVAFLVFALAAMQTVTAQVIVRNDFVINGKGRKLTNRGITQISVNLDRHQNLNYLINGRGGHILRIDVDAIRHPRKVYSYSEVAEKVYVSNVVSNKIHAIPLFLLLPPPRHQLIVKR
jgi:hypothetical protein